MTKIGIEGRAYLCAAGIGGTPTWTELKLRSITANLSKGEADVSSRPTGSSTVAWKKYKGTLIDASFEIECVWDTADPGYLILRDAFLAGTAVGLAIMDGAIATAGSQGPWADCEVLEFSREEPVDGEMTLRVVLKPAATDNEPQWKTIPVAP